jgi:hypothetical protein
LRGLGDEFEVISPTQAGEAIHDIDDAF